MAAAGSFRVRPFYWELFPMCLILLGFLSGLCLLSY
jgi:hypothetical protein